MESSGKLPADLARELGIPRNRLYKWKKQLEKRIADGFPESGASGGGGIAAYDQTIAAFNMSNVTALGGTGGISGQNGTVFVQQQGALARAFLSSRFLSRRNAPLLEHWLGGNRKYQRPTVYWIFFAAAIQSRLPWG